MSLSLYKRKRNFKKTAEPAGKEKRHKGSLLFVVQQHSASHLHWDFRLEMEGVLKSWAVPKGPSMNPDDKRLAMMVEDHPYDYKDFEGTIPEGNYGAGNVIVWDNGTYESRATGDKKDGEKILLEGLKKGHITFILHGKKLKGEFALVQMKGRGENTWLLLKKNDEYASKEDILKKDKSVISRKKLELRKPLALRRRPPGRVVPKVEAEPKTMSPKKKRELVKPMLASIGEEAFDSEDWIFEIKYDGYRATADIDGNGEALLYSRNLLSFNDVYGDIVEELKKIKRDCVLDGEVVVEDSKGRSHFQLLQQYQKTGEGPLLYYVFDLLRLDGKDIANKPLIERKKLLEALLKKYKPDNIYYSEHIPEEGIAFYKSAEKNNLEGIMAKNANSLYYAGKRTRDWLKIKINKQQEAVIIGITEPRGSRKHFGSLLLGVYENGGLEYCGNCGTGFNDAALKELYQKFEPYFIDNPPKELSDELPLRKSKWSSIRGATKVQWMKPKFVCEVKYTEWTGDGSMRHPVYLGLRKDKAPEEVVRELTPLQSKKKNVKEENVKDKLTKSKVKNEPTSKAEDERLLKLGSVTLKLTNQNKIYFPDEGITKGELVSYYNEISSFILPYLKDRPESLNRYPNGIKGESFFQKDMSAAKLPKWIPTKKVYSESNDKYIDYLLCNDKATLVYLANLGCIEINPWNSKIQTPENPDWVVIDLDPEDISFSEVVTAAREVYKVLEEIKVPGYCKTSGATGIHIYIPLAAKYDYDIAKEFAHVIASIVNERLPKTTSILRLPKQRQKRVYLDFLQNRRGQTLAAPYSARPKPGATVSTPLEWDEVNAKLDPSNFTIRNILKRLEKKGDVWKPVIGKGADIKKALGKIK